jgi:hypothetical protein
MPKIIMLDQAILIVNPEGQKKKKNSGSTEPGVNEVSFRARPHHNVHGTLGVDTGATGPL